MTDPYRARLERARATVAAARATLDRAQLPTDLADQLAAAAAESGTMFRRMATVEAALLAPGRYPAGIAERPEALADELRARLLAAMAVGDWRFCAHVNRAPQPTVVRLAARRVDCRRCLRPFTHAPPPGEDDRCDLCGAREVTTFYPVRMQAGIALVLGDMCADCAADLGHPTLAEATR